MPKLSRRQILSVAAFAGATVTAPASLAKANPDAELLMMVSAYREADAAVEVAPGGPVLDAALDRLQQLLEILIKTQAKTSQGAALKMSVIAGADAMSREEGLAYLDGEIGRKDYSYDVRLAFSVVRDFLMMGTPRLR